MAELFCLGGTLALRPVPSCAQPLGEYAFGAAGSDGDCRPQAGRHGHSSVEDAVTAMELYRLVEVQWEQQEASSLPACPEDREPDSGTDTEQYMEDRYWPEDLAPGPSGGAGDAQDRGE